MGGEYRDWAVRHGTKYVLLASTILSTIGCLVIIVTYFLYKDIRSTSRHIIFCISVADLIVSLSNLSADLLNPTMEEACVVQSFIGSTFLLSSFLWTLSLAIFLHISLVLGKPSTATAFVHPWFHLVCWLLPLAINMFALITDNLGNNRDLAVSGWCWINIPSDVGLDRRRVVFWMFMDGKGWEIFTYVIILIIYVNIKIHLSKQIRHFERKRSLNTGAITSLNVEAARAIDQKLVFIPISYILLRIWGTIRFVLLLSSKTMQRDQNFPFLLIMQALGDNLIGAVNCIFFCFLTPKVWSRIKNSLKNFLPVSKKENGAEGYSNVRT